MDPVLVTYICLVNYWILLIASLLVQYQCDNIEDTTTVYIVKWHSACQQTCSMQVWLCFYAQNTYQWLHGSGKLDQVGIRWTTGITEKAFFSGLLHQSDTVSRLLYIYQRKTRGRELHLPYRRSYTNRRAVKKLPVHSLLLIKI